MEEEEEGKEGTNEWLLFFLSFPCRRFSHSLV